MLELMAKKEHAAGGRRRSNDKHHNDCNGTEGQQGKKPFDSCCGVRQIALGALTYESLFLHSPRILYFFLIQIIISTEKSYCSIIFYFLWKTTVHFSSCRGAKSCWRAFP